MVNYNNKQRSLTVFMYNSKIRSRGTVSHDQSWTTVWISVSNEDGEKQSERMNANKLSQHHIET